MMIFYAKHFSLRIAAAIAIVFAVAACGGGGGGGGGSAVGFGGGGGVGDSSINSGGSSPVTTNQNQPRRKPVVDNNQDNSKNPISGGQPDDSEILPAEKKPLGDLSLVETPPADDEMMAEKDPPIVEDDMMKEIKDTPVAEMPADEMPKDPVVAQKPAEPEMKIIDNNDDSPDDTQADSQGIRLNAQSAESRVAPSTILAERRVLGEESPLPIVQFAAAESAAEPLIVMLGGLAPDSSDFLYNDELLAAVGEEDIAVSFGGDDYEVHLPSSFGGVINAFERPGQAQKFIISFTITITPGTDETFYPWLIADGDLETEARISWNPDTVPDSFVVALDIVVEYSDGVIYAGQILSARPQAKIVSQCIFNPPSDCPKSDRESYAAIAAYNQWAENHNADKMRIMMFPGWYVPLQSCKKNDADPQPCYKLRGSDSAYRLALASEMDGDELKFKEGGFEEYVNGESGPAALAEFLEANEEVLAVIPTYSDFFPDFHAATPLISPAMSTTTLSLCRHDDAECRANPAMTTTLDKISPFSQITGTTDLSASKNQIIAVGAVVLTTAELPENNAPPEKHATHPGNYGVCGIAKEWCITAVDADILTPPILPVELRLRTAASDVSLEEIQQPGAEPFRARADPGNYLSRSAAPRVAAVAAEVIAESGLEEAQATQKILFKTAFKCRDDATGENRVADTVAQDDSLSFACGEGATPLDSDLYGQGILNRDGAAADARTMQVADANGQQAGKLSDAKFRASSAMGDGLSSRLAEVDLLLKAESGNTYHHRPLKEGLSNVDDSHDSSARIDGFGRTRKSQAFSFVGGEWSAHHRDAFTFDGNPDSVASGFSFASSNAGAGAFSFSYDAHLLPSVFDSGESILPEAKRPPFMNFIRRGWRAEWESPAAQFRVSAAMGDREDSFGDSSAAIGMIEYDISVGKQKRSGDGLHLKVQAGAMTENNRLLGSFGEGAFSLSDGRTAFAGIRAEWKKDEKSSLFGAFYRGITTAKGGALFADEVRADSESWTFGVRRRNLFSLDDSLEFSIHQPLRVVGGEAKLSLASDRNGDSQDNSLPLSARGRELDFGISYRHPLSEWSEAGLGFLYRQQPGHIPSAAADRLAVLSFQAKW